MGHAFGGSRRSNSAMRSRKAAISFRDASLLASIFSAHTSMRDDQGVRSATMRRDGRAEPPASRIVPQSP
jgi:hypothetical protein